MYKIENKKLIIIIILPFIFILQYYFFKVGIIEPMVKGIDIDIVEGDYVKDLDKFTMKLNDSIELSSGDYIVVPSYAKEPKIWFNVLDNNNVINIKDNVVTSLKEGIASVAIMKDTRVLKKINIKVIDPKVEVLEADISNKLYFVGDSADIESSIEVDYDKFKEKEKINYSVTNENVLKIEEDKLVAVGVGKSSLVVSAKDKEQIFDFSIKARIKDIVVNNDLNLIVDDKIKLDTKIITSPRNLSHDKIKYELVENKLPIERAISIDKNGNIIALKKGQEKIKITCQDKSRIITIKVKNKPIKDLILKGLKVSYNNLLDKVIIHLSFNPIVDVYNYDIFLNKNSTNFDLFKTIKTENDKERISASFEIDKNELQNLSIYVIGKNEEGNSKPSEIVDIEFEINENFEEKNIEDMQIQNVEYELVENNFNLSWDKIDIENVTYNIYMKNNTTNENGFMLYESNIKENSFSLPIDLEEFDFDIYIVANEKDKYSKQSELINIKSSN